MSDPFPNIDEFGEGATTCNGTMTGCAVCATGNVLVRFGKSIPRTASGAPNMRSLGATMGARHRAKAGPGEVGNRHGLSLQGQCTGGTNWCAYCAFLQLQAQGVPVGYGSLTWSQIVAHVKARHAVILPGRYGAIPHVNESTYSSSKPARGRSDDFISAHMIVLWQPDSTNGIDDMGHFIVSDSDFGSSGRPVVPPHSVLRADDVQRYWEAYRWSVCYTTTAPPNMVSQPLWGPDVPAAVRAVDPGGRKVATAFSKVAHLTPGGAFHFGSVINLPDIAEAYRRLKWIYGAANPGALKKLLEWAAKR